MSASGISIDDGVPYTISYNQMAGVAGITLGSGGITASPSASDTGHIPQLLVPFTLSAPQAWSITAGSLGPGLTLGQVSGSTETVSISFTNTVNRPLHLNLTNDVEVGAITATGNGLINLEGSPFSLNGTDGNSVSLSSGASLAAGFAGSSTGPLTLTGGNLQVGQGSSPDGTLAVNGSGAVTLDSASSLTMFIDQAGTTPSTDYSQLNPGGNVNLGGAALHVSGPSDGSCPTLTSGDVYTLVSTPGTLTGTFSGIPDGTEIALECTNGTPPNVQINYTPHTVTATVVGSTSATATTTTLSPNPTSSVTNQTVTLTATVTAQSGTAMPTGTVAFSDQNGLIAGCTSQPLSGSGTSATATCQSSFAAANSPEQLSASYSPATGSSFQSSATASPVTLTVNKDSSSTALAVSNANPTVGQNVTYTATVTPTHSGAASPSGTVEFLDGTSPISGCTSQPLSGGQATCTTSYSSPGSHTITASYSGDSNFDGSTSSPQTVTVPSTPPINTSPPTISGTTEQGQVLTESHGTWTNSPTSYGYQWQDCDTPGNNCAAISGATSQTYTLTSADVCHTIRVQETATNTSGIGGPASSAPTAAVQSASNDFTWNGTSGSPVWWSTALNWVGCKAPSGAVGTITFPASACPAPPAACESTDNVAGLSASSLDVVAPSALGWNIDGVVGEALTLRSGLSSSSAPGPQPGATIISLPITLGGDNTWALRTYTLMSGDLSGADHSLAVNLSDSGGLELDGASNEVGPVTISSACSCLDVSLGNMSSSPTLADLNGSDGQPVTLGANADLSVPYQAAVGALTLQSGSSLQLMPRSGTAGSTLLKVTGSASVNGANLSLRADCNLAPGTSYTLVSASGGLSGTLDNQSDGTPIANGTVIQAQPGGPNCSSSGATSSQFEIIYTPTSVIATVPKPPTTTTGPAVNVTDTAATLTGTVDPGSEPADWYFTGYAGQFAPAQTVSAGAGPTPVSLDVSGLRPDTTYTYQLSAQAQLSGIRSDGGSRSFTTTLTCGPSPGVSVGLARFAHLRAVLYGVTSAPGAKILVEFGHTTSYGFQASGFQGTTAVPGIFTSGSTYHYRVIAYTPQGTSCTQDQTTVVEQGLTLNTAPRLGGEGTATPVPGKTLQCGGQYDGQDDDSTWLYDGLPVANNGTSNADPNPPYSNDPGLTPLWVRDGTQPLGTGSTYVIQPGDVGHWVSCVQFADNGWDIQPSFANFSADQSLAVKITQYSGITLWLQQHKAVYQAYEIGDDELTIYDAQVCATEILAAGEVGVGEGMCVAQILASETLSIMLSALVDYVDPPDGHFRAIALPQMLSVAPVKANCSGPGAARCQALLKAGNRLIAASARAASVIEAMTIAGNRFNTARRLQNFFAAGAQLAAQKVYEGLLVQATRSLESARTAFDALLQRFAGRRPRLTTGFRFPGLPGALAQRLRRDGVNPRKALALLNRDIKRLRNPRTVGAHTPKAIPLGPIVAGYRSITLHDIAALLYALRSQSAITSSSYNDLVQRLAEIQLRCTPGQRAADMSRFESQLLNRVAARYRGFMRMALAPLLQRNAPGLTGLPTPPSC